MFAEEVRMDGMGRRELNDVFWCRCGGGLDEDHEIRPFTVDAWVVCEKVIEDFKSCLVGCVWRFGSSNNTDILIESPVQENLIRVSNYKSVKSVCINRGTNFPTEASEPTNTFLNQTIYFLFQ